MAGRHVRNRDRSLGLKSKLLRCDRQLSQPARSAGEQARHTDQGHGRKSSTDRSFVREHVAAFEIGYAAIIDVEPSAPLK